MTIHETAEIMGPALAAGIMISLTHAPLGIEVLRRGIIFIDLAIAQVAGLGLVAAALFFDHAPWWAAQGGALLAALASAFFFRHTEKRLPEYQEAIIGCSFVVAASATLLLLSDSAFGAEEIRHLLSGQILFVTWADILAHAPVYAFILAAWFFVPFSRNGMWFYLLFGTAITSSVQLVGIYVVFASLILPALGSVGASARTAAAWTIGAVSVLAGITAATLLDAPAGPVLVLSYAVAGTVALLGFGACRENGKGKARPEGFEPPTS